ncbi:MAG: carboxypeptidase-like regulatory domain-containing protein, partial [Bryobacteraceae bacterium]
MSLLLVLATVTFAQTAGQITGEVRDSSGALVPDAAVTATNAATSVSRSTTTNKEGVYSFPDLTPGVYSVKVAAQGFGVVVKTNIEIQVQQALQLDFDVAVGQNTQTIEVAANAAQLSTENATVGTVIEEQRITDLPLNGRNFWQLVELSPNVTYGFTPAAQAAGREAGTRGALTMAMSGARSTWENYTLDGISNVDMDFNSYILQPSVDALQEFKVQSGVYPAEFGWEAGQLNVSTKPGSNQYHLSAWEFLRNDIFDARPYDFASATRSATNPSPTKQPYRQNQYGFTLGGPVRIPKLFNGKNRLFFMTNFEGYNSRLTSPELGTVLTAAMRSGDFSAIPTALADPNSRTGTYPNIVASPFPNNQIPQNLLSPDSVLLESKWMP